MKRFVIIIVICLSFTSVLSQNQEIKVTLKNGSTLIGRLVSIDPNKNVCIIIAGNTLNLKMDDIDKIENEIRQEEVKSNSITDTENYPDSFNIKIGEQSITMLLVKGGTFSMGYDGRHSLAMKCEPAHKVKMSSFYISKGDIPYYIFRYITKKQISTDESKAANITNIEANKFIKDLCGFTGKQYALSTEAQWEFAAVSPIRNLIFTYNKNWCSDYFGNYPSDNNQIDPKGPLKGDKQVIRYYSDSYKKYDRSKSTTSYGADYAEDRASIHIVIDANKIDNQ